VLFGQGGIGLGFVSFGIGLRLVVVWRLLWRGRIRCLRRLGLRLRFLGGCRRHRWEARARWWVVPRIARGRVFVFLEDGRLREGMRRKMGVAFLGRADFED
jgi:hypothetical protein